MFTANFKGPRHMWFLAFTLFTVALLALPAAAQKVDVTNFTSDLPNVPTGSIQDPHLVNAWGLSIAPTGPWWVTDNGTGLSTLYNATGQIQSLVVTIPTASGTGTGTPTGTVYNASTSDFKVHLQPTPFLFCTEDGTVSGWYAGSQAYVFKVNPLHKRNGLFAGELWVDSRTYLPLREWGELVKSPSIFVKDVYFVRDYYLYQGRSVPRRIISAVDTRLVGKAELTIWFANYAVGKPAEADPSDVD